MMRRFAALLALTFLWACTDEIDESTRPENIVGTYRLVTYGGSTLPTTRLVNTVAVQVLAGDLTLTADRNWTEALTLKTTTGGASQTFIEKGAGSWAIVREFAYISFNDKLNAFQFSGTASGRTIVLQSAGGAEMVYRR